MISKPFKALAKKDNSPVSHVPFEWNDQCEQAFKTIKETLISGSKF